MNNPAVSPEPSLTPPRDTESAADERARERWQAEVARQLRNLGLSIAAMRHAAEDAKLESFRVLYDEADGVMLELHELQRDGWRQDER